MVIGRRPPAEFIEQQLTQVVGIELTVNRIQGKWKTGQNQSPANRAGLLAGLKTSQQPGAAAMAALLAQQEDTRQKAQT